MNLTSEKLFWHEINPPASLLRSKKPYFFVKRYTSKYCQEVISLTMTLLEVKSAQKGDGSMSLQCCHERCYSLQLNSFRCLLYNSEHLRPQALR